MLTLHYFPGNASMTPHMLLEELGVPYALELVDRRSNAHKSPAYLKLNPNGLIPVLLDGDLVLYETAAICLHLIDTAPSGSRFAPPIGTPQRAHFYKWLAWLSNTLQATHTLYWYPERWADDEAGAKRIDEAGAKRIRALAEARIGAMLDQLDAELERHGAPWLLGADYSAVDPYALMLCRWTRGFARPARSLPHLGPYLQRVLERPAVRRVFEREELPQPWV
jgi:glutathione S-transferase